MISALPAIGILLPSSRAAAAKIDITPSIGLEQAYDSNVFNTNGNEKGDFILRATPALTFSFRMPETTLSLHGSITSDRYYKYTDRNSLASAISLGINATPIKVSPRFSVSPSGHFVQARDSFRRNQLVPSGDPLLPASIASETAVRKSRDFGGAIRVIYLVAPNTDFSVGGGITKRQFLDNVSGGDVGSRVVNGDTMVTYRFNPLFSSGLYFSIAYNTFDNGVDSRTLGGGLTGSYQFTPSVFLNARAGASRMRESDRTGILPDRTTWWPAGSFSLVYSKKLSRLTLTGLIDQSGGGSFGRTTRRQSVGVSFVNTIAQAWTADLSGIYEVNRSLDAVVSEDLISATGTAGVGYLPAPWATIRVSGTTFHQWSNGTVGTDLTRYSAFLGITLGYTYNIY